MSVIRILPDSVSNKIAAGEVIERPASVLKELLENSIDAKAKSIKVAIEAAGSKLIAVTDDGVGMDADDTLLCLEPHGTSKIHQDSDINRIVTMGFRGEAIPSVASVSRFRLRSRRHDAGEGNEVYVEGGKLVNALPAGCAPGTEILVKDLFFNVPARKKFLKNPATEERHIHETFCLLALANPEIAFELQIDGRRVVESPADPGLLPRLALLLGKEAASRSVPVALSDADIHLSGYVSTPGHFRDSRREQRVFINRRPIRANVVYQAIKEAYGSLLMRGCYPVVTLFIDMPPEDLDINVHPAKHEARFRDERKLGEVVERAIRAALRQAATPAASVNTARMPINPVLQGAEVSYELKGAASVPPPELELFNTARFSPDLFAAPASQLLDEILATSSPDKPLQPSTEPPPPPALPEELSLPGSGKLRILGFLANTYILAASEPGLLVIDQHAAHERVLFERLMASDDGAARSQRLLLPVTLSLTRPEHEFLRSELAAFSQVGFVIEPFGEDTMLLTAIPPALPMDNVAGLVSDMLNAFASGHERNRGLSPDAVARAACSAAVKAHDRLSVLEAERLVRDLARCELPFCCPHGRPTVINLSFQELEKRFGRKV